MFLLLLNVALDELAPPKTGRAEPHWEDLRIVKPRHPKCSSSKTSWRSGACCDWLWKMKTTGCSKPRTARSGSRLATERRPDVIILNLELPDITGIAWLQAFREVESNAGACAFRPGPFGGQSGRAGWRRE